MTEMSTNIPTPDAYASATRSEKSIMRSNAMREMMSAVRRMDMDTATAWGDAIDSWKSNTRSVPVRDYAGMCRDRVATLRHAADMIESGLVRPNGVPDEIVLTFDESGTADDATATRIASESVTRSEKSDLRGSIAESVVDHMTVGAFYTCTEIAHMTEKYAPAYVGRRVSGGAVRNALESNKISNVRFVPATADTVNGCVRES